MVRGQYLSNKKLRQVDHYGRISYLVETFGVPQPEITERLEAIWGIGGSLTDRLHTGAKYLWELTHDPKSITGDNLGAIIRNRGEWERTKCKKVNSSINQLYGERRKEINEEHPRLNVTDTQLLREDVIPKSELLTVKDVLEILERWPKVVYGENDWLRGTRIPIRIEENISTLLGIYWGAGSVYHKNSMLYGIMLSGSHGDFKFYENVVSPLINQIHCIPAPIVRRQSKGEVKGRNYVFLKTEIKICSEAITTWLVNDLGFPITSGKIYVSLPQGIDDWKDMERYAFFKGIVGTMGSLRKKMEMILSEKDKTFIDNLKEFSEILEFTPRLRSNEQFDSFGSGGVCTTYQLAYSRKEVDKMAEMGFANPKHQRLYKRSILN
jgi:hypothetical protein